MKDVLTKIKPIKSIRYTLNKLFMKRRTTQIPKIVAATLIIYINGLVNLLSAKELNYSDFVAIMNIIFTCTRK